MDSAAPRLLGAGVLWGANMAQKASVLAFSICMSRAGGVQALGVLGAVLAFSWVGGTLAGRGLPDRALFLGAVEGEEKGAAAAHGRFLLGLIPVHVGLIWAAPWVGGVTDFADLARWMAAGAALQGCTAFVFTWLRGRGVWRWEALSSVLGALVLVTGCWLCSDPTALGQCWTLAAGTMLAIALSSLFWECRPIVPEFAISNDPQDWWYLLFGLGCWGIDNLDVFLVRGALTPSDVGILESAKAWTRAGALIPWLVTSLTLRADPQVRHRIGQGAVLLGICLAGLGWLLRLPIARAYAISPVHLQWPLAASLVVAPILYLSLCRLLWAAQRSVTQCVSVLAQAWVMTVGIGVFAVSEWGIPGAIGACGVGQAWTAIRLRGLSQGPWPPDASERILPT